MAIFFFNTISKIAVRALSLLVVVALPAAAEVVDVEATYSYDTRSASSDVRIVPKSCPPGISQICNSGGLSSANILYTKLGFREVLDVGPSRVTGPVTFKIPYASQNITLREESGGGELVVGFRLTGIGGLIGRSAGRGMWPNDWDVGIAPCSSEVNSVSVVSMPFFWTFRSAGACSTGFQDKSPASYTDAIFTYGVSVSFGNPYQIRPGVYRGRLTYTVGSGPEQDIQMRRGSSVSVTDSSLTINFKLTVNPVLRVDVPAGGSKVELSPVEGWQVWLRHGRKPTKFSKDQTFHIWATSPYTVRLECAVRVQGNCALQKNGSSPHLVPLEVSVSLPSNFVDRSGSRVSKRIIGLRRAAAEVFRPIESLERAPASLHFEIQKDAVSEMLEYPGSQYSGTVTVIWETTI